MSIHSISSKSTPKVPQNETAESRLPPAFALEILTRIEEPNSPLSPTSSSSRQANDGSGSDVETPRRLYTWQRNRHSPLSSAHPGTPSCLSEPSDLEEKDQVDEGDLNENGLSERELPSTITRCRSAPLLTDSEILQLFSKVHLNRTSSGTRSAN